MRPSTVLLLIFLIYLISYGSLYPLVRSGERAQEETFKDLQKIVSHLALSDLAISTEARYTRHPAVSDGVVVSMDHPGALDHFPSTLFWAPRKQ